MTTLRGQGLLRVGLEEGCEDEGEALFVQGKAMGYYFSADFKQMNEENWAALVKALRELSEEELGG